MMLRSRLDMEITRNPAEQINTSKGLRAQSQKLYLAARMRYHLFTSKKPDIKQPG